MKKLIYLITIIYWCNAFGQKQSNIWYFGDKAGIDFNAGSPLILSDGQTLGIEGTSVISDSSGSLLFYSDGMTVWNREHEVMLNGSGLLGNSSSTQSSIVVPDPSNSDRYYYLFTTSTGLGGGDISDGLRYSKVDMCLDSALGGIINEEKNIKLVDTITEKIAVTRHSNGIDYWILTHKFYSDEFWALHLSSSGIVDTIITAIGSEHTGAIYRTQGQLKFSYTGDKIAIVAHNGASLLELFDFDKTTGIVSNLQQLDIIKDGADYGVEFSQDGSKLYTVSTSFTEGNMDVCQYDLAAGDLAAINASIISLYNNGGSSITLRGLQIGPDGKIYMVSLSNSFYLATINNPNANGIACDFQDESISLATEGYHCLPNFIAGFDYSSHVIQCAYSQIDETLINPNWILYPNPGNTFITLTSQLNNYSNTIAEIYNIAGMKAKEIKIVSSAQKINVQELAAGVYLIALKQNDSVLFSGSFVKE